MGMSSSSSLFSRDARLNKVQRMREELSQLWEWKRASPQKLLARLTDWCDRADRSGIQMLRNVARELRSDG